jgi:hypothetical protein
MYVHGIIIRYSYSVYARDGRVINNCEWCARCARRETKKNRIYEWRRSVCSNDTAVTRMKILHTIAYAFVYACTYVYINI